MIGSVRVPSLLVWWRHSHSFDYALPQCWADYGVTPYSLLIWAKPAFLELTATTIEYENSPEHTNNYSSKGGVN